MSIGRMQSLGNKAVHQGKRSNGRSSGDNDEAAHVEKATGVRVFRIADAIMSLTNEYRTRDDKNQSQQRKNDFWARVATIAVALYTGITFILLGVTWKALDYTIQASRLDQRAWVGAIVSREEVVGGTLVKFKFTAVVKNTGKTPAIGLKGRLANPLLVPKGKEIFPFYKDRVWAQSSKVGDSINVLFPGMQTTYETDPVPFPQNVSTGDYVMHIVGTLEYDDIFVPPTRHCTVFCYTLTADLKTLVACLTSNYVTDTKCDDISNEKK